MGRPTFADGDRLFAADVQGIMDQAVPRFADTTERDADYPDPEAGALCYVTADDALQVFDGADWQPMAGAGGLADQGAFTYLDATEASPPATPGSGKVRVYAKTDGRIYSKDDAGNEYGPFDAAGAGAGPKLYQDTLALGSGGDDFADTGLSGWTKVGSGAVTAVTTEPYDANCLDLVFAAHKDRIWKAIAAGDWTYYLTLHGIDNDGAAPTTAVLGMFGIAVTDDSGTGTAVVLYTSGTVFVMSVSAFGYASTAATGVAMPSPGLAGSNMPIVLRLSKSGTTISGAVSFDGGLRFNSVSRTDSTTHTRVSIARIYSSGGTNPRLRVGRFRVA